MQKRTRSRRNIIIVTFLLALVLSACGKKENEEIQEKAFGIDHSEELAVQRPEQVICGSENAWAITTVKDDFIYKLAFGTGGAGLEKMEWKIEEGDYSIINIGEQNGTLLAEIHNKEKNTFEIRKCHAGGEWSNVMSIKAEDKGSYAAVGSGFFMDSNGNVYLVSGNTVMRFDGDGKQTYTYELRGNISFFQENNEGYVECVVADTNVIILYELIGNKAEKKWTLEVSAGQVHGIQSNDEGTLCLATNEDILFLDRETGALLSRTNLVRLGVASVVAGYHDVDEGTLQLYGSVRNSGESLRYSLLSERDAFTEQRMELVYGMVGETNDGATSSIWNAITTFNQENQDYYVTIKKYGGWFDMERLHADMAAGDGPDIIDMTYSNYYDSYVKNGYLEDLSPYLEQSQYKDDIIWNVLDAYRIDGGLYLFTPKFQLKGILIHPEYEAFVEEWNMETFLDLIEKNNWDKDIFGAVGDPESLLSYMLCGRQEEFINWEQKTVAFETEEFMDMLVLCKEYAEADWSDHMEFETYEESEWNTLCKGVKLTAEFYFYLSNVYTYGREYQIYGYPTLSGQTYGITTSGDSCAIYAGSKQKEGAWEFIESLLWESNQKFMDIVEAGFPIRKSILKEKAVAAKSETLRTNNRETLTINDQEISIQEDIIYNGQLSRVLIDPVIMSIIQEETAPYFTGDKSVQDVAHIIQSRVKLMVGE